MIAAARPGATGAGDDSSSAALPAIGCYDLEDDLAAQVRATGQACHRVYRLDDTVVVLGRGSDARRELHLDACVADRVPLLRRRGGGCAVVIDPGNVIVAAALPRAARLDVPRAMAQLSAWLIAGLAGAGVPGVTREGVSDLVWSGRKVSGSCMHVTRDVATFSASLLVEAELELMERYLAHPPREPAYRQGRDHRAFLGCLRTNGVRRAAQLETALQGALVRPAIEQGCEQTRGAARS